MRQALPYISGSASHRSPAALNARLISVLATAALTILLVPGRAPSSSWNVESGSWFEATNWILGPPLGYSDAIIGNGGTSLVQAQAAQVQSVYVGWIGDGELQIDQGGTLSSSSFSVIGLRDTSNGRVTVAGNGSAWMSSGNLVVAVEGNGELEISAGGSVSSRIGRIGDYSGSHGTVSVTGVGSAWTNTWNLVVGTHGMGELLIADGGSTSTNSGYTRIGEGSGSVGAVHLIGNGSRFNNRWLSVGYNGAGNLTIADGGVVNVTFDTIVRDLLSATGVINFDNGTLNTGSLLSRVEDLAGTGTINTSGFVTDLDLIFNQQHGLQQQIVLNTQPSQNVIVNLDVNGDGSIGAGYAGIGSLTITDGRAITSQTGYLGYHPGSDGTSTVTGPSSSWTTASKFYVGRSGAGTLVIADGGTVTSSAASIAYLQNSTGAVIVTGAGTSWSNGGNLDIGDYGTGTLTISGGAVANVAGDTVVGKSSGSGNINFDNGTLVTGGLVASASELSGTGVINTKGIVTDIDLLFDQDHGLQRQFVWSSPDQNIEVNLNVSGGSMGAGYRGQGSLTVTDGLKIESNDGYLGYHTGADGTASVSGVGSIWAASDYLYVGYRGTGEMEIENGGVVSSFRGRIADVAGSSGRVTISGIGSGWTLEDGLSVGTGGTGTLEILAGGSISSDWGLVGSATSSRGTATVSGNGSSWANTGSVHVRRGDLIVEDSAVVSSTFGIVSGSLGTAAALITGNNSAWTLSSNLTIGQTQTGTLRIVDGGQVTSRAGEIGYFSGSQGDVSVSGSGSNWTNSETLTVGRSGSAELTIENGATVSNTLGIISENSSTEAIVTVAGSNSSWTNSGELRVGYSGKGTLKLIDGGNVSATGGVRIRKNGTVLGSGVIEGDVNNAGEVAPGMSIGNLQLADNYIQSATGKLLIELTSAANFDQLLVTGLSTLAGTLQVEFLDGFIPSDGQSFTILTADDVDGEFDLELFPSIPGIGFDVIYNADSVVLEVVAVEITGDYNGNGVVDAADYTVWRDGVGTTYTPTNYDVWKSNFGEAGGGSGSAQAAIPEPLTLHIAAMWLISALFLAPCRRDLRSARARRSRRGRSQQAQPPANPGSSRQ